LEKVAGKTCLKARTEGEIPTRKGAKGTEAGVDLVAAPAFKRPGWFSLRWTRGFAEIGSMQIRTQGRAGSLNGPVRKSDNPQKGKVEGWTGKNGGVFSKGR